MAATDISALDVRSPADLAHQSAVTWTKYTIDFLDSALTGIETVATHNLVVIPIGDALVAGYGVVTTAVVGSSSTVQFAVNGDVLTGALAEADLAKGDVFSLNANDKEDTAGVEGFAHTAATTLDVLVGTATLTAGVINLYLGVIKNA